MGGFIAGLTDYFIRMGLSTDTTTTASTFRKHNKHKNKKNKKDRKRNKKNKNKIDHKTVEVEKDESMDVEPVEDVVAEDALSQRLWRPKVPPARTTQTDCNQAMTSGTKVEFSFLTSSQINFDIDTTKCHLISL